MIQGGDLHENSIGVAAVTGFPPPNDECLHKLIFDKPFLLALASKGPNTTNSQVSEVPIMQKFTLHC